MEEQPEFSNIDKSSVSDEKSSSLSIPRDPRNIVLLHPELFCDLIPSEQISTNQIDEVRGQVLADNDAGMNVTECNYPSKTKTMNLPGSSATELSSTESGATEIARQSTSKSAFELKSQSSQEYTQKNDSDNKFKENQDKCQMINTKVEESTDLTANIHDNTSDSFAFEPVDDQADDMNDEKFVDFMNFIESVSASLVEDNSLMWRVGVALSKINVKLILFFLSILPQSITNKIIKKVIFLRCIVAYDKAQKVKKLTVISDSRPKTTNDEKIMDSMNSAKFISTQMSKDKLLKWAFLIEKSKYLIFIASILPLSIMTKIIKRFKPLKPTLMITYDKARKDKKPEDIQDMKVKIHRKECLLECFTCLKRFIILLILILFSCLFEFDSRVELVRVDKNDEHADTFETSIVELEKGILDHDATVRAVTKYLERNTPLLKVVALIGDTSVDKPYTVDIIKKILRKRRRNGPSPTFPTFIVLENLRAEHSKVVINYAKTYQEAYGNREFSILAVFKVEQIDDDWTRADINHVINTVKDIFIEANIIMKIIPFKPLNEDTLEKHIRNTAKNIGQTFSQDQIDYHKRRLIEDDTNCQKEYGC
ncbi:uncharacterized protein LOC115238164 [Formica exsecta]|uniref:uncharacterized protein LOC115238164 n=1 Tax=Formica exsecta TaxID=72781 RepID=UPI0011428623|nr:uncharacterized protein LOC115238164 [Formica exsecta]